MINNPPVITPDFLEYSGDGSDGDVTLTAALTTLARDMFYNTLTVTAIANANDVVLATAGFKIFVKGAVTLVPGATYNAYIRNNGLAGVNATSGSPAAQPAAPSAGTTIAPARGGVGGTGGAAVPTANTVGNAGATPAPGASTTGYGAAGGAGGASGKGGKAGTYTEGASAASQAAGTLTAPTAAYTPLRTPINAVEFLINSGATLLAPACSSGSSGGSGGGSGSVAARTSGASGQGGGGGSGGNAGGPVVVIAGSIVGTGYIESNGGNGYTGLNATVAGGDAAGGGGGGGGAGGGAGGIVIVMAGSVSATVTLRALGGTKGTGGGVGTGINQGVVPNSGSDGTDGSAGLVITIKR